MDVFGWPDRRLADQVAASAAAPLLGWAKAGGESVWSAQGLANVANAYSKLGFLDEVQLGAYSDPHKTGHRYPTAPWPFGVGSHLPLADLLESEGRQQCK